ncbi:MAG: hypothetical protein V1492_03230 [Candidatus Micrarchaeota archaeon]
MNPHTSSSRNRFSSERREGERKPEGQYGRRPEGRDGRRPEGQYGRRPEGQYGRRPEGSYGRRPEGDRRPEGSYGRRPEGRRSEESSGKSYGDKPGSALREKFMRRSRETVQNALMSRDMVLSGVAKTMEEMHKIINQLTERFESWYEIYFPEFKLEDRRKYVEVAVAIDRSNMSVEQLGLLVGATKAQEIVAMAGRSLGAKLNPKDLQELKTFGHQIITLYQLLDEFEKYQTELAKEIAPNISELAGADIAAKLIAHTGSLERLAKMPSSTIQVLGAEKALFKHLKNRNIAPPKHGLIFQHAKISNAPKQIRGKIARALANKIAIAAKADAFTKNFIAAQLKRDFEDRVNEVTYTPKE